MSNCKNLPISKDLNVHETDLANWDIVVFTATTTALLFYHMTQQKSIKVNRKLAAIITVLIISVSVLYNIYSLYNFFGRTEYLRINANEKCEVDKINESRIIYGFITTIIVITQLLISFYICKNSFILV